MLLQARNRSRGGRSEAGCFPRPGRWTAERQGDAGDVIAIGAGEAGHRHGRMPSAGFQDPHPVGVDLDEPPFGQDRRTNQGLLDILDEHLDAGTTLIAATHDPRFVADVATRVVTITAGRVTADESA